MNKYYEQIEEKLRDYKKKVTKDFVEYLKEKQKKYSYTCIWGVGNLGRPTAVEFQKYGLKVDFFCDNNPQKWGKEFDGIKCITPEELYGIKDNTWIIICARAYKEIYRQLNEMGYKNLDRVFMNKFMIRDYLKNTEEKDLLSNVQNVLDICADERSKEILTTIILEWLNNESGDLESIYTDNQYFCEDIFKLDDDEVFIDGGAYNGDTLQKYLEIKGENFEKLILFELSQRNFVDLKKNVHALKPTIRERIELHNEGISDRNEEIWYEELDEGSSEEKVGTTRGYLVTIDDACKNERVTYIKMDIEGSELAALTGAQKCICKNKPKLALCLYHKPWDLWEIPVYIKRLWPEYKIYIRHHTDLLNETVCYAVL